ncbi:Cell envelope-associated transcriptional attenuator [Enhygromyxa salina]|uniref:Cell envelope-associated transcriptional attenuator n=1 Tax=Enhygromyxa salina TaxID=215803 RepID=A0A0C1ZB13_9BACT|nr:LCP family protein [Enhygromyxa salina]KIG14849.1 Cell envelope-associated transcriptional attenuator [Enhygromyxa salina]
MSPGRKRGLIYVASSLSVVALLMAALAWALVEDVGATRHTTAKSFRELVGAPEAPVGLSVQLHDEGPPGVVLARRTVIPDAPAVLEPPPAPPRRPPGLDGVSFVLLLGADNRTDKVVGRTDAMIVLAFRHRDGNLAAFSIPRDLWVALPDLGSLHEEGRDHARVSSVVRIGEVRLGAGQGLPLLRQVLLDELGIRIDRYASIDFAGFEALVDELGGVDVDVECPIMDCFWINGTDQPCVMMSVDAGRVHMNGATALQFVRSRHGTGDRDRTKRQQAVILAFARKVQARGLRGLSGLWTLASPFVRTDLEADDAAYYASFALENQLSQVRGFSIRHPMTRRHVAADNKHVLLLDRDSFDAALGRMFEGELPALRERARCPAADAALN